MMRKTAWEWRGNYFDPEVPVGVDLHFRFWNDTTSRICLKGVDQFYVRRQERRVSGFTFQALSAVDSLGYAALHVFHHLQMGGLTPYHVYELASFLDRNVDHDALWNDWQNLHDRSLRRVEAISFRLARDWFACQVPAVAEQEIDNLPNAVHVWFQRYGDSPLRALVHPNKHSLWLHLSLLESTRDKARVFCHSLLPLRVPPVSAMQRWSLRTYPKFLSYAISRLAYHVRNVPGTLWEGLKWWLSAGLGKQV
jgi:hypothetical protein